MRSPVKRSFVTGSTVGATMVGDATAVALDSGASVGDALPESEHADRSAARDVIASGIADLRTTPV
jgi:hypothetical protein